jgi:hypothetical protein
MPQKYPLEWKCRNCPRQQTELAAKGTTKALNPFRQIPAAFRQLLNALIISGVA